MVLFFMELAEAAMTEDVDAVNAPIQRQTAYVYGGLCGVVKQNHASLMRWSSLCNSGRRTQIVGGIMPGGNTNSRSRPYQNLKGGGQKAPDVRALSGSETFGDEQNMQLFEEGPTYKTDTELGLSKWNQTPDGGGYGGNANGYLTEKPGSGRTAESEKVGSPVPYRGSRPMRNADPEPGGGWE